MGNVENIVTFNLNNNSSFAFKISDVDSVNEVDILSNLSKLPKANKHILGIFTYRKEKTIPCIDLNSVLNIEKDYEKSRVIVVKHQEKFIAFKTGSNINIKKVNPENNKELPDAIKSKNLDSLYVEDEIYTLLNVSNLINENLVA